MRDASRTALNRVRNIDSNCKPIAYVNTINPKAKESKTVNQLVISDVQPVKCGYGETAVCEGIGWESGYQAAFEEKR